MQVALSKTAMPFELSKCKREMAKDTTMSSLAEHCQGKHPLERETCTCANTVSDLK